MNSENQQDIPHNNLEHSAQVPKAFYWPFIVVIVMLLAAAMKKWPYDFYTLLRFGVCGVAVYGASQAHIRHRTGWVWTLGATALLFNPLAPIHLRRDTWVILDFLTACLFGCALFVLRRKPLKSL